MTDMLWPDEQLTQFTREDWDAFLIWTFQSGASDAIIDVGYRLCIKHNDEIRLVGRRNINYAEMGDILAEIYQPSALTQIETGEELDFSYSIMLLDESILRFRVNVTATMGPYSEKNGFETVVRTNPGMPPSVTELGVEAPILQAVNAKNGMFLVSGSTGSGKTTLLASIIGDIAVKKPIHILTYECPVEFDLQNIPDAIAKIKQSEIPVHVRSFAGGAENALRRAPHMVYLGELRTQDAMAQSQRIAQGGHLLLSTLHANSAAATPERMADEFPANERTGVLRKLVGSLRCITHQRLVSKRGGGLVAIREYLVFNESIRQDLLLKLINSSALASHIQAYINSSGQSLVTDAKKKLKLGLLDLSVYINIVTDVGTYDDYQGLDSIVANLFNENELDDEEYQQWLTIYKELCDGA